MCANYGLDEPGFEAFVELKVLSEFKHEAYPGYNVPAIRSEGAALMRWGLIPFWSKTDKPEYSTFNAKSETIAKSPAFREPFKKRRCLLPATHFFEWSKTTPKVRHRFGMADGKPFVFAGLWDSWGKDDKIESCTLITTTANEALESFHHRMPVILHESDYGLWLDPKASPEDLLALLVPYTGGMDCRPAPKPGKKPA
jgi:putative SOS response-associated peptidase YedK